LKLSKNNKAIAIGTALGVGLGVTLNSFPLGLAIGIVFSVGLIQKNKEKSEK